MFVVLLVVELCFRAHDCDAELKSSAAFSDTLTPASFLMATSSLLASGIYGAEVFSHSWAGRQTRQTNVML